RRDSQGRQQVGEFGGGAEGADWRVCVGISSGAPRFVGLRRGFAADFVYVEGQDSGNCDYHEDGASVCAGSKEWKAAVSGDGSIGSALRHVSRAIFVAERNAVHGTAVWNDSGSGFVYRKKSMGCPAGNLSGEHAVWDD